MYWYKIVPYGFSAQDLVFLNVRSTLDEPILAWYQGAGNVGRDVKSETTVRRLERLIETGELMNQGRLPAERELAGRIGVSRGTLRRALAALEASGRIWRHVGRGTFVGPRPPGEERGNGAAVIRFTNPAEVMEVRLVVEPSLAALAALRATAENVEQMETCLRKADAVTEIAAYERWDSVLHRTIAEAARNTLLLALFNAVNAARDERVWGRLKEASLTRERQKTYSSQHRALVTAIRDRNADLAARLMTAHLETVHRDILRTPPVADTLVWLRPTEAPARRAKA
jgi:DNA-binding FadR family transcriptional regulator